MYLEHFELTCRPFEETPDHRFLYMSTQHARALANIQFALTNRDNFVVISGEIGMGKTTLLNRVLEELPNDVAVARIAHTTLNPTELLHKLLGEFGIRTYKKNKVYLLDELRQFLLTQKDAGHQVAILVDEAQNLSTGTLEELRLLSSMDFSLSKLVSVVLVGQPNLNDLIDSPKLEQLRQRVRIRQHLLPLNEAETAEYIDKRLEVAGSNANKLFTPEALACIHAHAGGVPRLVNTLCDMALTACWADQEAQVNDIRINEVAAELGWTDPPNAQTDIASETGNSLTIPPGTQHDFSRTVHGWLRQAGPDNEEFWVPILHLPFSVGRTASNRLQLRSPFVSRNHAVIEERNGQLWIRDGNSRNGTFINATRIELQPLNDGDRIVFGEAELSFHMRVEAPSLAPH